MEHTAWFYMTNLTAITSSIFSDISFYLNVLSKEEYSRPLTLLNGSSIGQHTRHVLEFFECLIKQVDEGLIDYDARQRNKLIEQNLAYAATIMESLAEEIAVIDLQTPLRLSVNFSLEDASEGSCVQTTFGRELVYNIEHCIHHLAIVRIALHTLRPDLLVPPNFGVAPSTVKYKQQIPERA